MPGRRARGIRSATDDGTESPLRDPTDAHRAAPGCPYVSGSRASRTPVAPRRTRRSVHGRIRAWNERCGYRVPVLATRLLIATTVLAVLGLLASEAPPTQAARFDEELVATYDADLHVG